MNYVIVDLEFNNMRGISEYIPQYSSVENEDLENEIIEIGAVKLDPYMKKIDTLKLYIKPVFFKVLNPRVKEITGISEEVISEGVSFNAAFAALGEFVGQDSIICSWAKDDVVELIRNANYHGHTVITWLKDYIDLQEYCTKMLAEKKSLSLKSALNKLKIRVDEKELHDALYDAVYTGEVLKRVFNSRVIKSYIVQDITNMPSITIREFENFTLDNGETELKCPKCKLDIEFEYPLKLFKWRFMALGYCRHCGSKILQEVVVKKNLKGDKVYTNVGRVIDDVEYSDFSYKFKEIS